MISICIPIYNCDIRKLVRDLHEQAEILLIDYEIQLIDDASDELFRTKNREISTLSNVNYKELSCNIGRSAIRNKLAEEAQYRYLIFMDCDAQVSQPDYIRRYAVCCFPNIVCFGGCQYSEERPDSEYCLRWLFGSNREDIDVQVREREPNTSFRTFNFLIDKHIFQSIKFSEELKGYGHEDTLFGIELQKSNIKISHIDNPLIHLGLEDADVFIVKTEESIKNLVKIQSKFDQNGVFSNSVKLLKTEKKIASLHLTWLVLLGGNISKKCLLKNLRSKHPKLLLFDLYKLIYICLHRKENGL